MWFVAFLFALTLGVSCQRQAPPPPSHDPTLPGISGNTSPFDAKLRQALAKKSDEYKARTRHLREDGKPKYVNRLIGENSPYLLQHAHNPVNWHAWGEEAFTRAKAENKPILLSIGYATCHWCHVMERESFEDTEIAAYINEHFIPIKVDREERPDIDDIYMKAVQQLTGRGGWPLTVALTPNKQPFFGGTYFPPKDGARGARRGFTTVLSEVLIRFHERRDSIIQQAAALSRQIAQEAQRSRGGELPKAATIAVGAERLASHFDADYGGFGRGTKFPQPSNLELLLRYARRAKDDNARTMVLRTLRAMALGGIYDHLGGGFHRYATDRAWRVPHFEKMLYDNAQLIRLYLSAYQITKDALFSGVAKETADYVLREMTSKQGGFYSATDADSLNPEAGEDEEGWYFTWTLDDVLTLLGEQDGRLFASTYDVTAKGDLEGRNVLRRVLEPDELAKRIKKPENEVLAALENGKKVLFDARQTRSPPLTDTKVISAWNGLMISALSRAGQVLGRQEYLDAATRAASFIMKVAKRRDSLPRIVSDQDAPLNGFLDDYAFMSEGLLDLYEATGSLDWFQDILWLDTIVEKEFLDATHGAYFLTGRAHETPLARQVPVYDGAKPSGNAVTILNLLRMHDHTGETQYRDRAVRTLKALSQDLQRARGVSMLLAALEHAHDTAQEVVLVGVETGEERQALERVVHEMYLPNRALTLAVDGKNIREKAKLLPVLKGKSALGGKATAFVCELGRCELPTQDPARLRTQLDKIKPLTP